MHFGHGVGLDIHEEPIIHSKNDVKEFQKLINQNNALVFIYPVFWGEAPSKLVGWFQ